MNFNLSFKDTPSFFNDDQSFAYLCMSSYYTRQQFCIGKLINFLRPKKILEFGSALGHTTLMYAEDMKDIDFKGYDIREEVVSKANLNAKNKGLTNVEFLVGDQCEIAKQYLDADFIYMLYSFHHIPDPLELKVDFLKSCYKNMKVGANLCISETFLPDNLSMNASSKLEAIQYWEVRGLEGYASTFWNTLQGISPSDISKSKEAGVYSKKTEIDAGYLVGERNNEYLVTASWLRDVSLEIGFNITIEEPINNIGERIFLLKK